MKRWIILALSVTWAGGLSLLQAKPGKIFFSGDRWLKGDVQFRTDPSGREVVVVTMDSGPVVVPRSEIKTIVYTPVPQEVDAKNPRRSQSADARRALRHQAPALYDPYIRVASSKHQLDPDLVKAVIKQESNFNRKDVSSKGAQGLMQLMPDTAKGLGVQDAFDPWENIHGGTQYLRLMLESFNGDLSKALAAYNAGPAAVKKYGTVPPYDETQNYVKSVLRYYDLYRGTKLFSFRDKNGSLVFTDQPYLP